MKAGQLTEGLSVTALHGPAPRCSLELSSYYLLPFSPGSRCQTLLMPRVFSPRGIPPAPFRGRKLSSTRYLCCES